MNGQDGWLQDSGQSVQLRGSRRTRPAHDARRSAVLIMRLSAEDRGRPGQERPRHSRSANVGGSGARCPGIGSDYARWHEQRHQVRIPVANFKRILALVRSTQRLTWSRNYQTQASEAGLKATRSSKSARAAGLHCIRNPRLVRASRVLMLASCPQSVPATTVSNARNIAV